MSDVVHVRTVVLGRKNCSRCTRWRPVSDYQVENRKERNGKRRLRLATACEVCKRRANRALYRRYMADDPTVRRRAWRRASRKRKGKTGDGRELWEHKLLGELQQVALRRVVVEGVPWSVMSERVGWGDNTSRLQRALGLMTYEKKVKGETRDYTTAGVSAEQATVLCRALDVDPHEIGL